MPENLLASIVINPNVQRGSSELNIFLKHFPQGLFIYIADSTNNRLKNFDIAKHKKSNPTDIREIMFVVGCTLNNVLQQTAKYCFLLCE